MAKLVEILARELKEWKSNADGAVFSSKGGACYFFHGNRPVYDDYNWRATEGCFWFVGAKDKIIFDSDTPEDHATAIVTRAEWQAAVDALSADDCAHSHGSEDGCPECGATKPYSSLSDQRVGRVTRVPTWNGSGLPPVGQTCERRFTEVDGSSWMGCIILAHGVKKIFIRDKAGDEFAHSLDEVEFRMFRTPEQVAAEEKSLAVSEIINLIGWTHTVESDIAASRLYDAGYRKQEPK